MAITNATLTGASAVVYTCSNSAGTATTALTFTNHSGSAVSITVHICPAGEAQVDENMILDTYSIPAGDSYTITEKYVLANTDTIEAFASTTSVVTVTISTVDF